MPKSPAAKFVDLVSDAKAHRHTLLLWPRSWQEYSNTYPLTWQVHRFDASVRNKIPNEQGVYAFLIQPEVASVTVSVLMYVGMTTRSLRVRFGEYLREIDSPKGRPAVSVLLTLYKKHMRFCCAPVHGVPVSKIEEALLEAFIPPLNKQYSGKASKITRAFT